MDKIFAEGCAVRLLHTVSFLLSVRLKSSSSVGDRTMKTLHMFGRRMTRSLDPYHTIL